MLTDNGIYFEFIPFTEENFDTNGDLRSGAKALPIDQTSEGTEYAIMLTTCSGAWRYLIGDVIKFTSVENAEIVITGRTKHFLSLCGEHLSVDNMTRAFHLAAEEMNLDIQEFCVCGVRYESLFAHQWYIGSDVQFDEKTMKEKIDSHLKILNDDYRVERTSALREVLVTQIPTKLFVEFLHHKGKVTAQTKFPRVLNGKTLSEWKSFIEGHGFSAEHLESVNIK